MNPTQADEALVFCQYKNTQYAVSRCGLVKNIRTGTILKQDSDIAGYQCITLWDKATKKRVRAKVHRMVAATFIGDITGMTINHKDRNKANNNVSNLEILSSNDNILHAAYNGAYAKKIDADTYKCIIRHLETNILSKQELCFLCDINNATLWRLRTRKNKYYAYQATRQPTQDKEGE